MKTFIFSYFHCYSVAFITHFPNFFCFTEVSYVYFWLICIAAGEGYSSGCFYSIVRNQNWIRISRKVLLILGKAAGAVL